ncbi:MAG: methylenetetrahydrofolate--tRNA-(uracil(54)-C(5))-methyltransferase (FADH(2)-oxidizing) TrmFO, partial [Myxococcales bacterium]|nr:methylenetetrahydrofolate--tRNA-(uracil(54)-C(5))-methyltransferase (FADH(2)-oxidizing) TrmFO [Myxococcales bacterium]
RYDKGGDDYLNCPLTREEYDAFVDAVAAGEKVELKDFETLVPFEGCQPIEVMVERGRETLAFGPMKPVGLEDPRTGRRPHAVVQLRQENRHGTLWNMVGFQTKLKWPEQKRIFRMIPGLQNAEFARLGSLHRNTFLNTPVLLDKALRLRSEPRIRFAGQIVGVEGYVDSTAMGCYVARSLAAELEGREAPPPPPTTMTGALLAYVTEADPKHFQPMNANFGLLPPLEGRKMRKADRKVAYAKRALEDFGPWSEAVG